MSRLRTFGWDAVKLSALTFEELNDLRRSVETDPANANPEHKAGRSIYLYTKPARRKLDALGWAVFHKLQERRRATPPD